MDEAAELFERASKRAREGDHEKAIQQFVRGLGFDPLQTTARRELAKPRSGFAFGPHSPPATTVWLCASRNVRENERHVQMMRAMNHDFVVYQFSREKMERGDFSPFLSVYGPDKLPTGRKLRDMMNTFTFMVEGYDNDPREIHSIPEVRQFYAAFHEAWPYWLYFCNLDTEEFRAMVLCCLPSIAALKVDRLPNVKVEYDQLELLEFLRADFGPMNAMCERGGMFENLIYARTKAVFEYFGLPFDAPPP